MRPVGWTTKIHMVAAGEGNETRQLALGLSFIPVVPPLCTPDEAWLHSKAPHKRRYEIERLFRRLKGFSRFEKLDVVFITFMCF
jgi:hypothetical protein